MANTDLKSNRSPKPVGEKTAAPAMEAVDKAARTTSSAGERATNAAADASRDTFDAASSAARDMTDAAFSATKFEMPEAVRSFAEQGLTQTREAYGRMKAAAEEATGVMEESFETTRDSMRDVQFKALDVAQANAEATFEFARKLLTVTSVSDAVQLQASFARNRFEAFMDYSKDMQGTLTRAGMEASKPAKALFERTVAQVKHA